jgi:UDP-N-acetylmuramyl pentapeptide phosphotransferase/UDP-N-acetylglucosamine-1-phosphate transferase
MLLLLLQFISIFSASFGLTYLYRKYAIHRGIFDLPNARSSHIVPTPRGGGIAVAIAMYSGFILLFVYGRMNYSLFMAILCGIPISIIGFIDDIKGLRPGIRSIVQMFCAILALYFLGGLQNLDLGFVTIKYTWLLTVLAVFGIIWSINLFNFLDGIDGYIGTEIVFIGLSFFLLTMDLSSVMLAMSVLGFLIWNWPKAKIFMGDVGSTLLGFIVAIMIIYYQNEMQVSIIEALILTSVFWFDATVTLFRRIANKEKLNEAHRKHAYQRIVQAGFSHQPTVLWALVLNFVGFGLAWLAMKFEAWNWLFLMIDLTMLLFVLRYIDRKKAFDYQK